MANLFEKMIAFDFANLECKVGNGDVLMMGKTCDCDCNNSCDCDNGEDCDCDGCDCNNF